MQIDRLLIQGVSVLRKKCGGKIDTNTDDGKQNHSVVMDLRGMKQTPDRIVDNDDGAAQKNEGSERASDDGISSVSVGINLIGIPFAFSFQKEGKADSECITEIVYGIGDDGYATGKKTAKQLEYGKAEIQEKGNKNIFLSTHVYSFRKLKKILLHYTLSETKMQEKTEKIPSKETDFHFMIDRRFFSWYNNRITYRKEEAMDRKWRSDSLDDFWDISDLIPKREGAGYRHRPVKPKEIYLEPREKLSEGKNSDSDTVIVRYIDAPVSGNLSQKAESYERTESYAPSASLLHEVTLKKRKSEYRFYGEFLEDAVRLLNCGGTPCDYVSFFSYVPQYSQLNERQMAYYLWFRDCFLHGERIRIDYSYVLLFIYERINLGALTDVKESQKILTELWYAYHEEFPALSSKLSEWICDFSLVHRLPPPEAADERLVRRVPSLKEFYLTMPDYDVDGCVASLMKHCSSYDYRSSKFATEENLPYFEKYVPLALNRAVSFYSKGGKILSDLSFEDSLLTRDAYAGALCVADERYRIEVRYCSFSRSNELRFLVGDVIKYAENKIRAYLGIKSRMTVYSIPGELQRLLDEFFAVNLSGRRQEKPKKAPEAYDALYEIPLKPLSLRDAAKIELESWETTEKLVSAFEEETESFVEEQKGILDSVFVASSDPNETDETGSLRIRLAEYIDVIDALCVGDKRAVHRLATTLGTMPEALADRINEVAFEIYGDGLIEEIDGGYAVIEDYLEFVRKEGEKE